MLAPLRGVSGGSALDYATSIRVGTLSFQSSLLELGARSPRFYSDISTLVARCLLSGKQALGRRGRSSRPASGCWRPTSWPAIVTRTAPSIGPRFFVQAPLVQAIASFSSPGVVVAVAGALGWTLLRDCSRCRVVVRT